jgi:hypothetical protein
MNVIMENFFGVQHIALGIPPLQNMQICLIVGLNKGAIAVINRRCTYLLGNLAHKE